jgi:hypothetical protein
MQAAAGRNDVPISAFGVDEDSDLLKRYRDAGVERVVVNLSVAGADEVLPELDRWAALMAAVNS